MTTPDLAALLKIAEAATPGPWAANDRMVSSRPNGSGDVAVAQPDHKAEYANAAHIAAFNPTVAKALVEGMKVLEELADRYAGDDGLDRAMKEGIDAEIIGASAALSALTLALKGSNHG